MSKETAEMGQWIAFCMAAVLIFASIFLYVGHRDSQQTKRLTTCITSGGSWVRSGPDYECRRG